MTGNSLNDVTIPDQSQRSPDQKNDNEHDVDKGDNYPPAHSQYAHLRFERQFPAAGVIDWLINDSPLMVRGWGWGLRESRRALCKSQTVV